MDDRGFDALTRALASGTSRRRVLRGLFGLGGGALTSLTVLGADAARRPTPTPKPQRCPGSQVWDDSACVCTSGSACGSACCHPEGAGSDYSECCDGACCHGRCYGEELCCPRPRVFCEPTATCCSDSATCCGELGCLDLTEDQCCSDASCPPNSTCNLERLSCECDAGFIDCGSGCIEGTCCNNDACAPDVCYDNDCCHPATCVPGSCGDNIPDNCGGTLTCSCTTGVCHEGQCCTPKTCLDYSNQCGSDFPDDCGGTLTCSCPAGVCHDGHCCSPKSCADYPNQCGNDFNDGCGGTVDCDCATGVCHEGECCVPETCSSLGDVCGENLNDSCGGTISCPCASGICYQNTCCQPKTCADFPGQCGMSFPDQCGGTVACDCSGGQHCSNGVCVSDILYCGPNDDQWCDDGNCALGVDGNYYMINGAITDTGDDCMFCTSNEDCVEASFGNYPYCLQIRDWTDQSGTDRCELCPAGGGGLCGRWYVPS